MVIGSSSVFQTSDSGYIVAGSAGTGHFNPYLLKLDKKCDTLWSQIITGPDGYWSSAVQVNDSDFIACGSRIGSGGRFDGIIGKINGNGIPYWLNSYGSIQGDWLSSIKSYNNGFICSGSTVDTSGNIINFYLVHIDDFGNILWSRVLIFSYWDTGTSVIVTSDNNILVAGTTALGTAGAIIMLMELDYL